MQIYAVFGSDFDANAHGGNWMPVQGPLPEVTGCHDGVITP